MTRWSDQPPSPDFIDLTLKRLPQLLRKHSTLLLKIMPPFLGFALFLQYFYRNQFYPSFDLFQFSSLLLAAACVGVLIVGFIVLLLMTPGILIFHGYLNQAEVKERITTGLPTTDRERHRKLLELFGLAYLGPIFCAGLIFWTALFWLPNHPIILIVSTCALVASLFGVLVTKRFNLPRRTALQFLWTVIASSGLFIALTGLLGKSLAPYLSDLSAWAQMTVLLVALIALAFASSISATAHLAGWSSSLLFSAVFGLAICGLSGLLTSLPETVVRAVGLGAYEAKSVELAPPFCETGLGLAKEQSCRLEHPTIVWSLGETLVVRTTDDPPVQLQIPSNQVKAIVQYPQ